MTTKTSASHLIDENPILVLPTLAAILGINQAIVLQQLHFLLNQQRQKDNRYVFIGERWWVYNSYAQWRHDFFPWLSESAVKAFFRELEGLEIVVSMQGVKNKRDRRKWYSIDYLTWELYATTIGQNLSDG